MSVDEWLPISEPPTHSHLVLVSCEWGDRHIGYYLPWTGEWGFAHGEPRKCNPIIDWQELPKPRPR